MSYRGLEWETLILKIRPKTYDACELLFCFYSADVMTHGFCEALWAAGLCGGWMADGVMNPAEPPLDGDRL